MFAIQCWRAPRRTKQLSTVTILLYRFLSCWCLETFFTYYQPCSLLSWYKVLGSIILWFVRGKELELGEILDRGSTNLPRSSGRYVIMFIHMTSSCNHVCEWPIGETQKTRQSITIGNQFRQLTSYILVDFQGFLSVHSSSSAESVTAMSNQPFSSSGFFKNIL